MGRDGEGELVERLRRRAEELRTAYEAEVAATRAVPPPEAQPDPEPAPAPAPPDILSQWADEDHVETVSPDRNWSPIVAGAFIVVALGLMVLGFVIVLSTDDAEPDQPAAGDAGAGALIEQDAPPVAEMTADVTVPADPREDLVVADQGFTIVTDPLEPQSRVGTFAVLVQNPNDDFSARGVQVDVTFVDDTGAELGHDNAFVEVILPDQTVAVAALIFDAPSAEVADLRVDVDVARWRGGDPVDGEMQISDVTTDDAEFSGVRTTFQLRSTFSEPLRDVGVAVVYRDEAGRIVGGSDTIIDVLAPDTATPGQIALLAGLGLDTIAATELYPRLGFGVLPGE